MDHPTRRLNPSDEPPDQPTRRLDAEELPPLPVRSRPGPDPGDAVASRSTCPECGGVVMTTRLRFGNGDVVVERLDASGLELLIHTAPKAKGRSPLEARVCIDCGFTRLYAANLAQLME